MKPQYKLRHRSVLRDLRCACLENHIGCRLNLSAAPRGAQFYWEYVFLNKHRNRAKTRLIVRAHRSKYRRKAPDKRRYFE